MSSPELPVPLVLFGVPVHNLDADEALERVLRDAEERRPCHVVTSNLDFLRLSQTDPEMHHIHLEADLVVPDGMPLIWLSRLFGPPLKERVTGSDLVPRLAERARDRDISIFAVGGAPGVAERALGELQARYPGLRVRGWLSPPMVPLLQMEHEELRAKILESDPHVVFVALGTPKQEKWIRLQRAEGGLPVAVGVGGSLDFLAGVQSRAPKIFQRAGLGWLWRLLCAPRRLFKRYASDFAFLVGMLARVALLRVSPAGRAPGSFALDDALLARYGARAAALPRLDDPAAAAAFVRELEKLRRGGSLILDLGEAAWLNSLELGVLVRAAQECRADGGRLIVVRGAPRLRALLRLYHLDRFMEVVDAPADLDSALERLALLSASARARLDGSRMLVRLPREFAGSAVRRFREEIRRLRGDRPPREVVVDAATTEYLDVAGARYLHAFQREVERERGGSVWLSGFSSELLERLRREGHDLARVDRRTRYRSGDAAAPAGEAR